MTDEPIVEREHRIDPDHIRTGTQHATVHDLSRRWFSVAITVASIALTACGGTDVSQTTVVSGSGAEIIGVSGIVSVNGTEVEAAESLPIASNDRISVEGTGGVGLLRFPGVFAFRVFQGGALQLQNVTASEVTALLERGHVHFRLFDEANARLRVDTSSQSVIRTLESGTEFTACQPKTGNTCLAVKEGRVELTSQGMSEEYVGGQDTSMEAAFLTTGQPPGEALCLSESVFNEWLEEAQYDEESPTLGELVSTQHPCNAEVRTVWSTVPGTEQWTDTGVDLESGDMLKIEAGGSVAHSKGGAHLTPDGDPDPNNFRANVPELPDLGHAALIGKIGNEGMPFLVGRLHVSTVEAGGRLFLGINDVGTDNNAGEFAASITITSP